MLPYNSQILRIQLLGEFIVSHNGEPIKAFSKPRLQSLLAYLVLQKGKPQSRSHIAYSFWPDSEEKQALTNLRHVLHLLKQAIPNVEAFLEMDSQTILWKNDAPCTVDIEEFEFAFELAQKEQEKSNAAGAIDALERISLIYNGDLLPKRYDEWVEPLRDELRSKFEKAQAQRIELLKNAERYEDAIRCSKNRIRRDNLNELNHYALIELLALSGDRAAALRACHSCAQILEKELGIEPCAELQELKARISTGSQSIRDEIPVQVSPATGSGTVSFNSQLPVIKRRVALHQPRILFGALGLVASIAVVALFYLSSQTPKAVLDKSIAILPFANLSDLEADEHFAYGVHDDLIARVSRIRDLKTISRTSVEKYRSTNRTIAEIGEELGVATILEGGIQRFGDSVRINVQLIDVKADGHVWANTYIRELTAENLFSAQTEIIESIAEELKMALSMQEKEDLDTLPTYNLAALDAYFLGRREYEDYTADGFTKARKYYERAVELDPEFALAHASLAKTYLCEYHYLGLPAQEQFAKSEKSLLRALELDHRSSEAYVALGALKKLKGDALAAEEGFLRALELDPNNVIALRSYATLKIWQLRDPEGALPICERILKLDPLQDYGKREIALANLALGNFDEARMQLESLKRESPRNQHTLVALADLLAGAFNERDKAMRCYRSAHALDPKDLNIAWKIARLYEDLGDKDNFLFWAQRCLEQSSMSHMANFIKGRIHQFLGETDEAFAYFASMERSESNYKWIQYDIACYDARNGRSEIALERYHKTFPERWETEKAFDRNNYRQAMKYALLLHECGEEDKATALAKRVLFFVDKMPRFGAIGYGYLDAQLYLMRGNREQAMASLRVYVERGGATVHLSKDKQLAVLSREPEFQRLLALVESRIEMQLASIQQMEDRGELAAIPDALMTVSSR